MDVTTIQMEPAEAAAKLAAYRAGLTKRHSDVVDAEWAAMERAFAELAKGTPLIDPVQAIREAGWRDEGRPRLAMSRADQRFCEWQVLRDSRWYDPALHQLRGNYAPMTWLFAGLAKRRLSFRQGANLRIEVAQVDIEPPAEPKRGVAMVPMVPPDVITDGRGCDLSKHFVLWEVESWDAAPPVDPMLLKPIGGDLYAVVAQWDLTDLERAILRGTRRE
jgi:hypothetical protein